jgi:hypothetical protein
MNDYVLCTLEKRDWVSKQGKSGSTYCFNNSNSKTVDFAGHELSISISKSGESFNQDSVNVFAWVNKMTDAQYDAFLEEYGNTVYCHIPTESFLTVDQYNELGIEDTTSNAIQPQTS